MSNAFVDLRLAPVWPIIVQRIGSDFRLLGVAGVARNRLQAEDEHERFVDGAELMRVESSG